MPTDAWREGRGLGCGGKSQGGGKAGIGSFADGGGASNILSTSRLRSLKTTARD